MNEYRNILGRVKVAAPCPADWEQMVGTDRMRFCGQCQLNVYNLSGMTRREAERLVSGAEGRLCVRFYRRADGTILTKDCPVGLRAIKRRLSRVKNATLSAVISFFAGLGLNTVLGERKSVSIMGAMAPVTMGDVALPPQQHELGERWTKGEMIEPPAVGKVMLSEPQERAPRKVRVKRVKVTASSLRRSL